MYVPINPSSAGHDPLLMMLLGFALAMTVVVVIVLLLKRPSGYAAPGYALPPAAYPNSGQDDSRSVGCVLIPLLMVVAVALMAILS